MTIHPSFRRLQAPGTGRAMVQLTSGPGWSYPLYYYVPSITLDGRYLVHHTAYAGEVQLHRVDLTTGESLQLTHASAPETWWRPWCSDAGTGVLDHRSALDLTRDEVIFFDGQAVRAAKIADGATRDLFSMPGDRMAIGQNCVTPDGKWFVYIHADRAQYQGMFHDDPDYETYWSRRQDCRDTRLAAFDLDTGEHRTLLVMASPIHHVMAYDERHLLFCHPTSEDGMLLTDVDGGWYTHLRTQDVTGGTICHFLGTSRGATYEVLSGSDGQLAGICDPFSRATYEVPLPTDFGYVHTGRDPDGLLWFFENEGKTVHDLWLLAAHDPSGADTWQPLTGDWPAFGDIDAQKAHFHPQVVLDRQWMLLTGGDPTTGTNQLFLLDISDLGVTTGVPDLRSR